jgi:predicted extracellular nuclease
MQPLPPIRIHDIQATAHRSLQESENVSEVPGIVTAVRPKSFYIQDPEPDEDDRTSEGIVVFTKSASTVKAGDSVLVSGTVKEFRPGKAEDANLTVTEIVEPTVTVLSSNNELPAATLIGVGGRIAHRFLPFLTVPLELKLSGLVARRYTGFGEHCIIYI